MARTNLQKQQTPIPQYSALFLNSANKEKFNYGFTVSHLSVEVNYEEKGLQNNTRQILIRRDEVVNQCLCYTCSPVNMELIRPV